MDQFLFRDPYRVSDFISNGDGGDLRDYYLSWFYDYSGDEPIVSSHDAYRLVGEMTESGEVYYYAP